MIKGKTIIVVGASGNIGSVLSRVFHQAGAKVVLSARTFEKLEVLAKELGMDRALAVATDATKPALVEKLLLTAQDTFGHVDAVVITAGRWDRLSIKNQPDEAHDLALRHFESLFLPTLVVAFTAQRFFRQVERDKGLIINISSHAAIRRELVGNLSYGPMKAAARQFMLAMGHELQLEKSMVRAVDLQPAIVNTLDNRDVLDTEEKRAQAVQPEDIARWIIDHFNDPDIPAEHLFDSQVIL